MYIYTLGVMNIFSSFFFQRHEVEDSSSMPEDVASEHIQREGMDPQSVLRGARHMVCNNDEMHIDSYVLLCFVVT